MTVVALHRLRGVWGLLLVAFAIGGFGLGQVMGDTDYRQTSVDWTVVALSDDNTRLTISYQTGDPSCHADKVDVFEGSLYVRIRVLVRENVDRDCRDEQITSTRELKLEAPFADLWDARGNSVFGDDGRVGGIGRGT